LATRWRPIRCNCQDRVAPLGVEVGLLFGGQRQEVEAVHSAEAPGEPPAPPGGCGDLAGVDLGGIPWSRRGPRPASPGLPRRPTRVPTGEAAQATFSAAPVSRGNQARTRARVHVSACTCTGCRELLASLIGRGSSRQERRGFALSSRYLSNQLQGSTKGEATAVRASPIRDPWPLRATSGRPPRRPRPLRAAATGPRGR